MSVGQGFRSPCPTSLHAPSFSDSKSDRTGRESRGNPPGPRPRLPLNHLAITPPPRYIKPIRLMEPGGS